MKNQNASEIEKLENLRKEIENDGSTVGASLIVENKTELAEKYLTPAAIVALGRKCMGQTQKDERGNVIGKAVYFSAQVSKENLELGIEEMAKIANELAAKGEILSVLAPISNIELAHLPFEVKKQAVFFFPIVPIDKFEEIMVRNKYAQEMGGIGPTIGSIKQILPPGEFLAEARFSSYVIALDGSAKMDIPGPLFHLVADYLRVLPKGTVFIGATKCAVHDISISYELKFGNILIPDVKRVELDTTRSVAVTGPGTIEQFNVFRSIKYFDKDDKQLFNW